jgi:hypothetical protein
LRLPGIEPGTLAWKASMLTITPQTLISTLQHETYLLQTKYTRANKANKKQPNERTCGEEEEEALFGFFVSIFYLDTPLPLFLSLFSLSVCSRASDLFDKRT